LEKIHIEGASGNLQAAWHGVPESSDCLIICHPHPLFGGTMDNKVVTTLARTYLDLGVNVLRFNFRGIGQSDGEYGDISGEVQDCKSALKWLLEHHDITRLFLAGFSFGAYVAAKVAFDFKDDIKEVASAAHSNIQLEHLLLVAPSVINSPFEQATPLVCPTTVVMGGQDEVVAYQDVSDWSDALYPPAQFIDLPQASHFFHGQLVILKREIKACLAPHIPAE
jgi:alpha/beta superfamily hydrolase